MILICSNRVPIAACTVKEPSGKMGFWVEWDTFMCWRCTEQKRAVKENHRYSNTKTHGPPGVSRMGGLNAVKAPEASNSLAYD